MPEPPEACTATLLERAHRGQPSLVLDDAGFLRYFGEHFPEGIDAANLSALPVEDIFLAYGCLQGDPLAVALLQERIVALGGPILRRLDPSPAFADEVRQHVVERLLLAGENGASPKLAAYAGRGTLDAWLRPVIRGLALNLRRVEAGRKPAGDEALVDKMADLADPEIEYLRSRYRDDLRAAFCESLKALTARERNLLRLSLLGGVSVRRLGGMYRVGHSTIARWLTEARAKILESTRCALGERLGLSRAEVDSLLRALRSQIDDWLSVHLN